MKYFLLLLCTLLSSCVYGITVPPDTVNISASFQSPRPNSVKTISVKVEEGSLTKAEYTFTNQVYPPSSRNVYQSSRGKQVRITAQLPNESLPRILEFTVDEYTGVNAYAVEYSEGSDGSFLMTCRTPTKPCASTP